MRPLWIALAVLALTASAALGQIAAPSIAPGTFSSENPAAIKWGAPSRVGIAGSSAKQTDNINSPRTDYAGTFGGIRLVGERFAAAAEGTFLQDQEKNLHDETDISAAALAMQLGGSLAMGLGYTSTLQKYNATQTDSREPTLGASLRLGELWFAGATVGRESTSYSDKVTPANDAYGERDVVKAGIGLRRGGTVLVHLEAFAVSKGDYEGKSGNAGKGGGEEATGGTVEFTFWSLLIGGSARHIKYHNSTNDTADLTSADFGWAPREGLAITLHYESARTLLVKQPPATKQTETQRELGAVVATYQF